MNEKIQTFVTNSKDWSEQDGALVADFNLSSFSEVQQLVTMIMSAAETADHHPTVTFGYNTVQVKTVTHDAGDVITEKDTTLAADISAAYKKVVG